MMPADLEVAYGYTLHDLDRMTHAAMIADRSMAMDYIDRRDIAWSAIAEALCSASHWPRRSSLIQAGWQAIYRAVREEYRQHGYAGRTWAAGHASAPRFVQFWYSPVQPSHEERIVERIAVDQIVDTLTPPYRDAITALAMHGDYQRGADALGISYKAFVARIGVARRQTRGHWFEGETPRRVRTTDRRAVRHETTDPAELERRAAYAEQKRVARRGCAA